MRILSCFKKPLHTSLVHVEIMLHYLLCFHLLIINQMNKTKSKTYLLYFAYYIDYALGYIKLAIVIVFQNPYHIFKKLVPKSKSVFLSTLLILYTSINKDENQLFDGCKETKIFFNQNSNAFQGLWLISDKYWAEANMKMQSSWELLTQ